MTKSLRVYVKLKTALPAEQIQLRNMIPGMFLEACINDSEHIAVGCWMRGSNQSNQPALSWGCNEALSSWQLVSVGKMKIVSSSNKAEIKSQLQPLQLSSMLLLDILQPLQKIFELSMCVCVCVLI